MRLSRSRAALAAGLALGFSSSAFAQEPNFFGWAFGQQPALERHDQSQDEHCQTYRPRSYAYINRCSELIVPTDDPAYGPGRG
jgi:hypothetical protein